jgi:hypothetical protein
MLCEYRQRWHNARLNAVPLLYHWQRYPTVNTGLRRPTPRRARPALTCEDAGHPMDVVESAMALENR